MIIRRMEIEDVPQVAQIEAECFSQPWSEKAFTEEIDNPFGLTLVAVDNGVIKAFVNARVVGAEIYINNIAVGEVFRRQGIAKSMMKVLEDEVSSCEFITLEVRESNISAQNLYRKFGYEVAGKRRDFYEKPIENAVLMTKHFIK